MSPAMLRRYRAERMLRRDFEALRERVLASVRANIGARRMVLDESDLEACYAMAWQGLYTALTEGQEIENPAAWLTTACYRRAIDEYRARQSDKRRLYEDAIERQSKVEPDLAGALDDQLKLRHTFEALRQRLDRREQQAASLCYLQGLTRAQAAECMGISESGMQKLMEGRGPGRPGVTAKVGSLLKTVQGGEWCGQQASLMRGLAFGVHDPDGERYQLARLHYRECPACRAYVRSLRGLAAVLPPLALPWTPGMAGGLGGALGGGGSGAAGSGAAGSGAAGSGAAGSGAAGSGAAGSGAATGTGAAGFGAATGTGAAGGWLPLGGSLSAKLAAGCLLFAGVGGGCVAIIAAPAHSKHAARRRDLARGSVDSRPGTPVLSGAPPILPGAPPILPLSPPVPRMQHRSPTRVTSTSSPTRPRSVVSTAEAAQREFGFEPAPRARAGTASSNAAGVTPSRAAGTTSPHAGSSAVARPRGAESEFGPG